MSGCLTLIACVHTDGSRQPCLVSKQPVWFPKMRIFQTMDEIITTMFH